MANADVAGVTEDGTTSVSGNAIGALSIGTNLTGTGNAADTDIDGDTLTVVAVNGSGGNVNIAVAGLYGSLTLQADGDYTYALNNASAAVQGLATGETLTDSFSYRISDGHGGFAVSRVNITINGANDAPILTAVEPAVNEYTSGTAGVNIVTAASTLVDAESKLQSITLQLSVDANSNPVDTTLDSGKSLGLDSAFASSLTALGLRVSGDGNTTPLTITGSGPNWISPALLEVILEQVKYANTDTSFGFNANDREITITVTDHQGLSDSETVALDLRANVTDGAGNSEFHGGNLDDTINGELGTDTSVYQGSVAQYDIAVVSEATTGFVIGFGEVKDNTPDRDGTDTLTGVEQLRFQNGTADPTTGDDTILSINGSVQLFSNEPQSADFPLGNGTLIGTFNTIADALAAAGHGNVILVNGTSGLLGAPVYNPATPETITISDGVTLRGLGTVTVKGITIADAALAANNVTLNNLLVINSAGSPSNGIAFTDADGDATGTLTLTNVAVGGFVNSGLIASSVTGLTDITVNITNSLFIGNGTSGVSGATDINLFNFAGNASLTDVTVSGGNAGATDHAIQIAGFTGSAAASGNIPGPIGTISFDDVTVTGNYEKTLVYINGYNDFTNLSFAGGLTLGDGSSSATWTALYIEPQSAGGTFTTDPASALNLTGVDVAGGTYGTNLVFAVTYGSRPIVAVGTPGADTFTGTSEDEGYVGAAGNDTIDAGGGSDIALQGPGGGSDTFDGGDGTDVLSILNVVSPGGVFVPNPDATTITISDTELNNVDVSTTTTDVSVTLDTAGTALELLGHDGQR